MFRAEVRAEVGKGGSSSFGRRSAVHGWWGPGRLACAALVLALCLPSVGLAASGRAVGAGAAHTCVITTTGTVQCWGSNGQLQLGDGTGTDRTTPVTVTSLTKAATALGVGAYFTCVIDADGGVQCWGDNAYGQLGTGTTIHSGTAQTVSGLTSGVVALAVGENHACALMHSGDVLCWGANDRGQVGDGTTTNQLTPVTVSGLPGPATALAAGGHHTCAVAAGAGAMCWGGNAYGQLGDGSTYDRSTPTYVAALASPALTMAGGTDFTCALEISGGVQCWGRNEFGQLGDGTTTSRATAATVNGLASGVAALAAGFTHACAVLSTGALKCWGENTDGQVGDGSTTSPRTTPTAVSGMASGIAAVAAGDGHTCALESGGGARCWGDNASGQLGDGTTTDRVTAGTVSGLGGGEVVSAPGARQLSTGHYHACLVTKAGAAKCWGLNGNGALGDRTSTNRFVPVPVLGLASGVSAVTGGGNHSCALTTVGGVKCWGDNGYGQLGDGTITSRVTAVNVSGLASGTLGVSAGALHTCAVTAAGGAKCWGVNSSGQIGDGSTTNRTTPRDVTGLTSGVAAVTGGAHHTCALTMSGGVKCWGNNSSGQLGDGTTTNRLTPVDVSGLTSDVRAVAAGGWHTCALTNDGAVRCWGDAYFGQVGDGTTTARDTPVSVIGLDSRVNALTSGYYHSCAVLNDGQVRCWGYNVYGQLGDGSSTHRSTPVVVSGLAVGATAVAAGYDSTCAITGRFGVQCWGHNEFGALGDGTGTDHTTPGWVIGFVAGAGALSSGNSASCRLTPGGGVQCWGLNSFGQLGDGSTHDHRTPVDVHGLNGGVVSVSVGSFFACALTSSGGVRCWGSNQYGQLGDGTTTDRLTPADVAGLTSGAVALSAGESTACAVLAAGGVECWGRNQFGQLGDGTTTNRLTPTHVTGLSGAVAIGVGSRHACTLTAGGAVLCWGHNFDGELGDGTTTERSVPVVVKEHAEGVQALAVAGQHSCLLNELSGVMCWGYNGDGELGDGTSLSRSTPVDVPALTSGVAAIAAGASHQCAVTSAGSLWCWGANSGGQLGDGTTALQRTPVAVSGFSGGGAATVAPGTHHTCAITATGLFECWGAGLNGEVGDGTAANRLTPVYVRGYKQKDDYDGDVETDAVVYRPSTGTWFSLDSSTTRTSYRSRGWGMQSMGDVPVPGDYDGDGIVDPTVFRPSTGTWFILKSSTGFTTWTYFGWGTTGDTPVPADYDGDGTTDGAVYRATTGRWYIRPSGGGTTWNVVFGVAGDVPIPGHYDSDGKADPAVYRPSTGTWFVLTSSSGYASYWYQGWGVQAEGDQPAPGDYDGDGRLDPCVFRPSTGTWFVLESRFGFTTWRYYGWGGTGDTVVPGDYDGDGVTDVAIYRPSSYTWYVLPSSGATQWSKVFGASGDVPLVR